MSGRSLAEARAAKSHALALFERVASVVGVGLTRVAGGYGLKVNLRRLPKGQDLPDSVDGVPVQVEIVGTVRSRS